MVSALSGRTGAPVGVASSPSPEYAHPPLIESWLAVEFVEGRDRFEVNSPALKERLGPEWIGAWKHVGESSRSDDRQIENVMGDRAVRITTRGFAFGWLGYGGERYPRYEAIRDGFVSTMLAVQDVVDASNEVLVPRRWSVRYVNQVPQGTVWMTPGDWSFFRLWQPLPLGSMVVGCEGYKARWDLPLEDSRGLLTVKFRHMPSSSPDQLDAVTIMLQAKGPLENIESALFDGMDYGREVIVRAFNELVTNDAKAYWGVTHKAR